MTRRISWLTTIRVVVLAHVVAGSVVMFSSATAQEGDDPAAAVGTATTERSDADGTMTPRVVDAAGSNRARPDEVRLGDDLTVTIIALSELLRNAAGDCRRVILFLDERAMTGVPLEACDEEIGKVRFHLTRDEASEEAWRDILGGNMGTRRSVSVSVGVTDRFPVETDVAGMQLVIIPERLFLLFVVLLVAALVSFWWLARTTPMLRDRNAEVGDGEALRPYSLALTQLSIWMFLVVTAFVFLWLVTGRLDSLSASALVLVGLGSLTAIGANLIDKAKKDAFAQQAAVVAARTEQLRGLKSHQKRLTSAADKESMTDDISRAEADLDHAKDELDAQTSPVKHGGSQGFLRDILSDKGGVSIYRFQLLVWTVVLAIVFVVSVWRDLAMPDFGVVLLALMGISNGTYLGFKFPELH